MVGRACRGLRRFPALNNVQARGEGFEPPSRSTPDFKSGALPGYAIHAWFDGGGLSSMNGAARGEELLQARQLRLPPHWGLDSSVQVPV